MIRFILLSVFMLTGLLMGVDAMAQTPPVEGMDWLTQVIHFLYAIPQAQPVLGKVFLVAGALSAALTALAIFLETLLVIPQVVALWRGADEFAEKVKKFREKFLPWIKYLSMFNVQKKK